MWNDACTALLDDPTLMFTTGYKKYENYKRWDLSEKGAVFIYLDVMPTYQQHYCPGNTTLESILHSFLLRHRHHQVAVSSRGLEYILEMVLKLRISQTSLELHIRQKLYQQQRQ